MTKKKVLMTLEAEPYERLQANAKKANFPKTWFSKEIDKLVKGLNEIVEEVLRAQVEGRKLTDQEIMKKIVKSAETAFGVDVKDIMK